MKLETRFIDDDELWIRAFPDEAFLQSHNPNLTNEEKQDAKAFKELTSEEEKKQSWEELVSKYGVYRSSWLAQISGEELEQQINNNTPVEDASFYFKWLPDRLVYHLYAEGATGQPTYTVDGSTIDRDGLLVLDEKEGGEKRHQWLHNFDEAIKAGMGIKITINPAHTKFEKIIVSGFRYTADPLIPAKGLADLFHNHQYTEGFSFLNHGTPTNNTEDAKSGHSSKDEFEVADSYKYAIKGLDLESEFDTSITNIHNTTAGKYLAHSLGFETDHLKHVKDADMKPAVLNELYQKASWFALGAQPLFMLFGNQISTEAHESLWKHYTKYVKSKGLHAALKVGNQPYGILPAMNISNVFSLENRDILESDDLFDKITVILARLMAKWLHMVKGNDSKVPRLTGNDTYDDILKVLSMQEHSSTYQIRALEYRNFRKKLYKHLEQRPDNKNIYSHLKNMGDDIDTIDDNIESLADLLDIEGQQLTPEIDQLFRSPLLSFTEANTNLIGFDEENSVITNIEGKPLQVDNDHFSFSEEDLTKFKEFIDALKTQAEGQLVQYKGELSLFTDLFIKGYINAYQLYHREIVFDLSITDSIGNPSFMVNKILKSVGASVNKTDVILEIKGRENKIIQIKAPFDGTIKKIMVTESTTEEINPGTSLFELKNEAKSQKIKDTFITLGQQIVEVSDAIPEGDERKEAQKKAIGEVIDLNSYRLDAWITSLAAKKIDDMRKRPDYQKGIYFGAYGWVEDLTKDTSTVNPNTLIDISQESGGIIHTPSPAQTVASTIFKNSFLSHQNQADANPFTTNLTSDRIQKSQFLLDGIRQGQQLEALLGYQFERHLHESGLNQDIYTLRESFPLHENITGTTNGKATGFTNLSVIDGLKAIKNKDSLPNTLSNKQLIKKHIEKLEDTMDASLDTLFYEAGYQVTQGNLSQASAAIDATKGEIEPPVLEALKTKVPGTGIQHKLVMIFPSAETFYSIDNARAFAEPAIEKWLEQNIGDPNKLGSIVELYNTEDNSLIDAVSVSLADLGIGFLDFMYLSEEPLSDGASELELRIRNHIWAIRENLPENTRYVVTTTAPQNSQSLSKAIEVARYAKTLLAKCRYLKSEDITTENEAINYDKKALDNIKDQRLLPIVQELKRIINTDLSNQSDLDFLSKLDFETAKTAYLMKTAIDSNQLKNAIAIKITKAEELFSKYNPELPYYTAFRYLEQTAKILFGESFILLPPAVGSGKYNQVIKSKKQSLIVGDASDSTTQQSWGQDRIKNWVQGLAQIHENSEIFEDWMMVSNVWNQTMGISNGNTYQVVQGPTLLEYPWIALSKEEIDIVLEKQYGALPIYKDSEIGESYPLSGEVYYPDGSESTVIYAPNEITLEEPVYGVVIEEFSEHIPDQKIDTALSFNYNTPNNEPPQALLLAIHPKAGRDSDFFWSEDDLRDIISDTMDLYKIRMVDVEAIQEYGYVLPMTYWLNLPQGK